MSNVYGPEHRALQDQFDTRRMADLLEGGFIAKEVDANNKAFIESRDMFFLSTIDTHGQPTVSYKGGDPGFVKVVDAKTIAFPLYDGNGMFYSWGNIAGNAKVGLLFIDFVKPIRLRVQGTASVDMNDPLMMEYHEALGHRARDGRRHVAELPALCASLRESEGFALRAARGMRDAARGMETNRHPADQPGRERSGQGGQSRRIAHGRAMVRQSRRGQRGSVTEGKTAGREVQSFGRILRAHGFNAR